MSSPSDSASTQSRRPSRVQASQVQSGQVRRRLSAENRREQILQVAAELFIERGFEAVGMADIAAALGTSRPTIYAYFPSTEALLDALFQSRLELLPERLAPYLQGEQPAVFAEIFQAILQERDLILLLNSGGGPLFRQCRKTFLAAIETRLNLRELEEQRRRVQGRGPQPLLLPLILNLLTVTAYEQLTEAPAPATEVGRVLEDFILGGLGRFATDKNSG